MEMFVKRDENDTLGDTFKEAIKVEKYMLSLKGNPRVEVSKDKSNTKDQGYIDKTPKDKKDQESMDMEALQRIVKNISNEIIDMKKNIGEGTSNPKVLQVFTQENHSPHN
jgi:hypothetical protein